MPVLPSSFRPVRFLGSCHSQTILPSKLRRLSSQPAISEILETDDNDFLELSWLRQGSSKLVVISHGLEGSATSSYAVGLSTALYTAGWDVVRWNMRGCGEKRNRLVSWYHSGKSDDLDRVVSHARKGYGHEIALVGVSIGGNITLKYLGEAPRPHIHRAVAISVPCDLRGSAETLARKENRLYMQYLLRPLRNRIREKALQFPETFDISDLDRITSFREFDERYTAPFHGFASVEEYWSLSSSLRYLNGITTPTLLITSLDDPFLSPSCFPYREAQTNAHLFLEASQQGGHVGFIDSYSMRTTWAERRTVQFLATA